MNTIAVDIMGGDLGLPNNLPACIKIIKKHPDVKLLLVGDEFAISAWLKKRKLLTSPQLKVVHASESVAMDETPSNALRNKKDSSMRVAINLVKDNLAQACVSSGNTGALVLTAKFVLKTLPNIDRPAIISVVPTITGKTRLVDLGANIDCEAENLVQFALMGCALSKALDKKIAPSIGLLNIGVEEIKGNDKIKLAAQKLSANKNLNYIGFVEGNDIYTGAVDIIVCDGFIGNIALKSSEGLAKLVQHLFKKSFSRNFFSKLTALIAMPTLRSLKKELDPARYNGASLLGLNGIVVKSHGGANRKAFMSAIDEAILEVKNDVISQVSQHLTEFVE